MPPSAAWIAEANDPYGEALTVQIRMRADTDGGSNQLVVLSDLENVKSLSPLIRKREREHGVVEGMEWTVAFTHDDLTFNPNSPNWFETGSSILFKWAEVRLGFVGIDEWATFASGRVEKSRVGSDGLVRLSVRDPIMDMLTGKIPRDMAWTTTGWVSQVKNASVAPGSSSYNNNYPPSLVGGNESSLGNFTYEIRFTGSTTFDIIHVDEPAYNQTGLSTGSNQYIKRLGVTNIVMIPSTGWAGGTFANGDKFRLYTSQKYTTAQLNPITVLKQLISLAIGTVRDVGSGTPQLAYDDGAISTWSTVEGRFSTQRIEGVFEIDTEFMEMIEGILKGVNCTLFPLGNGRIGIYHFHPDDAGTGGAVITGNPNSLLTVSVLNAEREEDKSMHATRVTFKYYSLDGTPAEYEVRDDSSPFTDSIDLPVELESPWRWTPSQIENVTQQALNRRKDYVRRYRVRGTLYELAALDLSELLIVKEPELSESLVKVQVAQVALDAMENVVEMVAWADPVVLADFARINVSYVDSSDQIL
jgi:hypothetical protein